MFDPIIQDIEPLRIGSSDLDMSVYHELKDHPRVVMVTNWKSFFGEFYQQNMGDRDKAFGKFCKYWLKKDPKGFKFAGTKACTLADGRHVIHDTKYDPSGIVSEQQVGAELYPSRLTKEAEYEMHHDNSEEDARNYEYIGPWVSALMVQAKIERKERFESTLFWLSGHAETIRGPESTPDKEAYIKDLYRRFWKAYFKVQRSNQENGYGRQSKPLTIEQRVYIKREFEQLAKIHDVDLPIEWPEGDRAKTLHDILEEKKEELYVLYESMELPDLAKAEDLELEIESMINRIKVDQSELAPWISEWMTGTERENVDGDYS